MSDADRYAILDTKHDLCESVYTECRECFIKGRHLVFRLFDTFQAADAFADTLTLNPHQFEGFRVRPEGYYVDYWSLEVK